jgi:hypothetical protein
MCIICDSRRHLQTAPAPGTVSWPAKQKAALSRSITDCAHGTDNGKVAYCGSAKFHDRVRSIAVLRTGS